jgi:hypothetical protein
MGASNPLSLLRSGSLWQQAFKRLVVMLLLAALIDAAASYSIFRWLTAQTLAQDAV